MGICKYCDLKDEHGGDWFAMQNFKKISDDAEVILETMISTYLRIREIDGKPNISVQIPYRNANDEQKFGYSGKEINYCPFCGRNLMSDFEKTNSAERAKRAMLLMRQKTKGAADAES